MNNQLDIKEVADILRVNPQTLRRWDEKGILRACRDSPAGHRYYFTDDLADFLANHFKYLYNLAVNWSFAKKAIDLPSRFYCQDAFVFKARLSKLEAVLQKEENLKDSFSLVTSVVGEIGNNSFDHNLGNWPGLPGIFFGYDLNKRKIILADRGQGVLTTLKKVRPNLKDDKEALLVAFTETLSSRKPEHRGNGLKYVKKVIQNNPMSLWFHSGRAIVHLINNKDLVIAKTKEKMNGCFVILTY